MKTEMEFPGKILLFGEYGILLDSMALSLPFFRYSGRFSYAGARVGDVSQKESGSMEELRRLLIFLKADKEKFHFLDLAGFEEDLNRGLYFDSSIPGGFGLGSSGALTAALYSRYTERWGEDAVRDPRAHLSAIEACFHGISSGIDPLTSYLKMPVLLEHTNSTARTADLSPFLETYSIYLLNTRFKAGTSDLVGAFMADYQNPGFRNIIDNQYIPLIARTIGALVSGDLQLFETALKSYSRFQLTHLGKMIPATMKQYFDFGLDRDDFYLKICGSGGGGYMLAITRDRSKTEAIFDRNHLDYSLVEPVEIFNNYTETTNNQFNN